MTPNRPPPLPVPLFRARALLRRAIWRVSEGQGLVGAGRAENLPRPQRSQMPLRVGFVVCDAAKWGLGSLVAALQEDPAFEVGFYLTLSDVHQRLSRPERRAAYEAERAFFAETGSIWGDLYDVRRDRMQGAAAIGGDVIFVQQPWGMQDLPRLLARRVRVAYVHYGMPVISNDRMQFGLPHFHPWLWRYFVPTPAHADAMTEGAGPRPPEIRVTGHPKFDTYLSPAPPRDAVPLWPGHPDRKRVIFAPHHGLDTGSLGLGTFRWSGPQMLEMVRRHPQVDFLLRPHPNMAIGLARAGVMSGAQWTGYKQDWQALPNGVVHEGGSYWDTFRSSDAMITDSGSFLAEYLPTGAPLIRLEQQGAAPLNAFGAQLAAGFYRCRTAAELETIFAQTMLQGNDPLRNIRAEKARMLTPFDLPAAAQIKAELQALLPEQPPDRLGLDPQTFPHT